MVQVNSIAHIVDTVLEPVFQCDAGLYDSSLSVLSSRATNAGDGVTARQSLCGEGKRHGKGSGAQAGGAVLRRYGFLRSHGICAKMCLDVRSHLASGIWLYVPGASSSGRFTASI